MQRGSPLMLGGHTLLWIITDYYYYRHRQAIHYLLVTVLFSIRITNDEYYYSKLFSMIQ